MNRITCMCCWVALAAVVVSTSTGPTKAAVSEDLVAELSAPVDEALGGENPEAKAWALRARALVGDREARELLLGYRDNTDLIVRIFAGVGLVEMGRREGWEVLAADIIAAGSASRDRILERYVRHLSERDQVEVLSRALDGLAEADGLRDVADYLAHHGRGEVFALLARAADVPETERAVFIEALTTSGRPEAVDVAAELAGSEDSAVRLSALTIAASVGGEPARSVMEPLVSDPDPEVASAAAFALAPMGVPAAYERLLQVAQGGTPEERARALVAIRDGQPSLLEFDDLRGMLEGAEDPELRRRIFEALGATGSENAFNLVAGMLEGDVYAERLEAVPALGFTGREAAVPLLAEILLGGSQTELRRLAAEALGHLGMVSAAEPLLQALDHERAPEVKATVIRALATTGSEDVLWPLAFQLTNTDQAIVRAALASLRDIGASAIAPQVETVATTSRNPEVRWEAVLVLFALDPEVGQIRLMQALDSPPDGFMGDIDALPEGPRLEAYRRLVRHRNPDIRAQAATRVLRQPDGGLAILRELVEPTAPSDMRQLAVSVLTANRDPQDLPMFTEVADSSHAVMRNQALEAIVGLADPSSEEFLRSQLNAADLDRRVMAVYGLWRIGSQ